MTRQSIRLVTYLTLIMVYIIPTGLIFGSFNASQNHIFTTIVFIIYLINRIKLNSVSKNTLLFWFMIIFIGIYTKRFGFLDMLILPVVNEILRHRNEVINIINKTFLPYICIIFTFIYSALYRILGIGGRGEGAIGSGLIFTAIGEINLTGLSIFCLSLIIRKKNKLLSSVLFLFGFLTVSRSYMLAILCLIIFNLKFVKQILNKMINKISYLKLMVISSIILFLLGVFNIYLYLNGDIVSHSSTAGFSRLFVFNDLSNYFRFLAIYLIVMIIVQNPKAALLGFSNEEFVKYGIEITQQKGILFSEIGTHNLFFSHLKMYGIGVFLEIIYISRCLKKIITVSNFGIFIAVFFYCIILGTGLNNYWLYLSVITFILYE